MDKKRVLIIGGGASGLMAALFAAERGAAVTVLEQNDRPGRKICATGNGRCNMTNLDMPADAYRGSDPLFASGALRFFTVTDTIAFFSKLGIYTINRGGYIYPRSGQAQSVVDVLCMEAASRGVKIKTRERVTGVVPEKEEGRTGFLVRTESWHYEADAVILANGSMASEIPGSDGSGYVLARALGHTVVEPLPALTALRCRDDGFSAWNGVRTEGEVTLCIDGIPLKRAAGELQLTGYGISGIPVFQLSRYAVRALKEGCQVQLLVDFLPDFEPEPLRAYLEQRKRNCPYKNTKEMLTGLFPDRLIHVLIRKKELADAIKAFPLRVSAGLPFENAQVCSGGVATGEVDSRTMESRIVPGLYFAGELLDIDGACGGYNLQWAWSSGACAGSHSAQ